MENNANESKVPGTSLVEIVEASGLDKTKADYMLEKFQGFFKMASEWEKKVDMLEITSEDQVAEMKMAGEGRKFLKSKRIEVESTRKSLKEQSLREGKAIDGIANVLKALIIPLEERLLKSENFVEVKRMRERGERAAGRRLLIQSEALTQYIPETTDLVNMTDSDFQLLIKGARLSKKDYHELELEAAEQKRINELHLDRRESLIDLWAFVPEQYKSVSLGEFTPEQFGAVKDMALERQREHEAEQERIVEENKRLAKEKAKIEAAADAERKAAQKKIHDAQQATAKAQEELQKKKDAEQAELKRQKQEEKRMAKGADIDRMRGLLMRIEEAEKIWLSTFHPESFKSEDANDIATLVFAKINGAKDLIKQLIAYTKS